MGPEVKELEGMLQLYKARCITCASGTDALILSLLALKVGKGDKVVCPSFTFPATAESILITGATPIFIDVSRDTFNLCYKELEKVLEKNRKKVKAVIAVDLFGLPANYKKLKSLASKFNFTIISDAAQSFGASYDGKKVGKLTSITCTSFFPAKPLGCFGDGGAVFTDNKKLSDKLISLRAHGKSTSKYKIVDVGLNSRLDTIQAASFNRKMDIFDWELKNRNINATLYNEELEGFYEVPLVPKGTSSACGTVYNKTKIEKLINFLNEKNIPNMVYYPVPMHMQPAYNKYATNNKNFVRSIDLANSVLSIPVHAYLSNLQKEYIINNLKKARKLL